MILVADPRANDAVNGGVFVTLIVLTLPFPVTDFYFAFNAPAASHPRHVTLHKWLLVDGVAQCVLAASYVVATLSSSLLLRHAVSQLWRIFLFTWTTVGCVLFWHAAAGSGALRVYMWWRLLLGWCSIFAGWLSRESITS